MPFRAITGHRPLLELLARANARGTLPPSLIFAGPEGVGKRLTAIALAQALNCERQVRMTTPTAAVTRCGECAACSRIARGVHADVLVIEPGDSGTIKIEQVREAIDRSALPSVRRPPPPRHRRRGRRAGLPRRRTRS